MKESGVDNSRFKLFIVLVILILIIPLEIVIGIKIDKGSKQNHIKKVSFVAVSKNSIPKITQALTNQSQPAQSNTPGTSQPSGQNNNSSPPQSTPGPNTIPVNIVGNEAYYYVGSKQIVNASGASLYMTQEDPKLNGIKGTNDHSLMEIAAENLNGENFVETGWIVDSTDFNDTLPHLFVSRTVNGVFCFELNFYGTNCGFVQVSSGNKPEEKVSIGTTDKYEINFTDNRWYIYYNGDTLGYYPESIWSGNYTQASYFNIFGEVEIANGDSKCIQMGNGIYGSSTGSAQLSDFTILGTSAKPNLIPYQTVSSPYDYGGVSPNGLSLGGPGSC